MGIQERNKGTTSKSEKKGKGFRVVETPDIILEINHGNTSIRDDPRSEEASSRRSSIRRLEVFITREPGARRGLLRRKKGNRRTTKAKNTGFRHSVGRHNFSEKGQANVKVSSWETTRGSLRREAAKPDNSEVLLTIWGEILHGR